MFCRRDLHIFRSRAANIFAVVMFSTRHAAVAVVAHDTSEIQCCIPRNFSEVISKIYEFYELSTRFFKLSVRKIVHRAEAICHDEQNRYALEL